MTKKKHFINLNYSVFTLPDQIRIMSTRFGRLIVGATINPVAPNKSLPFKESVIISQQLRAPPAAIFTSSGCAPTCSPPRLFIYSPLLLCLVSVWLASLFFLPSRASGFDVSVVLLPPFAWNLSTEVSCQQRLL